MLKIAGEVLAVGASRASLFADMGLMGAGLGFAMLSLLLAVQHSVSRGQLGVVTSLNMFARSIGGAVGVAIMGAILTAGLGGSTRLVPGALEGAGIAGLDPEVRQRLILALQRAFASGAVAAGLALVVSFWVPPFVVDAQPSASEFAAEMTGMEPEIEPVAANE